MASGTIETRLAKLEEQHSVKRREPQRVFRSCVLKGREAKDEAQAFAALGTRPTGDDLHIQRAICGTREDDLSGFQPWAQVLPYGRRGAAA